jgi:hypothetical protein
LVQVIPSGNPLSNSLENLLKLPSITPPSESFDNSLPPPQSEQQNTSLLAFEYLRTSSPPLDRPFDVDVALFVGEKQNTLDTREEGGKLETFFYYNTKHDRLSLDLMCTLVNLPNQIKVPFSVD